jgi:hypothetical protein
MASSTSAISVMPKTMSPGQRRGVAVGEVVTPLQQVPGDRDGQQRRQPVPPHDAVAIPPRDREHQETQEQHEGQVDGPQRLRGNDFVRRVQVVGRHDDGRQRDERGQPAFQLVGRALFELDVLLGLVQGRRVDVGAQLGPLRLVISGHACISSA